MTDQLTEVRGGTAADLTRTWAGDPRWLGVRRSYTAHDVIRLRGTVQERHTLAERGARRLWDMLQNEDYVNALGALTGGQAVQQVRAGLKAIYLSGWQVAADANLSGHTYPDQSLYPANSVPSVVRRINNALLRADQIDTAAGRHERDWLAPIVADAEAGFGGPLNAFELMKAMIAAGAAGVHWEDQLASEKKCGHLGGKVLIPTAQHIRTLNAARLAADVAGVPSIIIAAAIGREGLNSALTASQVCLSVILPFVTAPLLWFTCRSHIMTVQTDGVEGAVNMRNGWIVTVLATTIWLVLVIMNVALLVLVGLGKA